MLCVVLLWSGRARAEVPGTQPRPERLSVALGLHGTGVLNLGLNAGATGAGRFTFRLSWPLGSRIRLGLRLGLVVAVMPVGEVDGELWLGVRPTDPDLQYDSQVATLLPSASFLFQVRIWRWLELDATLGLAAPMSAWVGGVRAQAVSPQMGLGLLIYVVRRERVHLALRFGCDAMPILGHPLRPWLFLPMAGVLVRFPVRDRITARRDGNQNPFHRRFKSDEH